MQNKLLSIQEAVATYTWDGMTYCNGAALPVGSCSIAFGKEMVKQQRKNLNVICHCGSQQVNLLAAVGAMDRVEVAFSGLEVYGFAAGLNRAVTSGKTLIEDYSNGAMALRFFGGAMNWPFVPTNVCICNDQQWCSADYPDEYPCERKIPEITDPFTGKKYGALRTLKPDVAAIHVTMADIYGNAIMMGTEWNRFEMSRAAKKVVLVADKIVHTDCIRQYPNLVRIISEVVDAVVYWPYVSWPQASPGLYDSDEEHMFYMNKMMKTQEDTDEYCAKWVHNWDSHEEYMALIGKEKIEKISQTETAFLMDPYRKWILSDAEIRELQDRAKE
ncbi:MAG: CoA transferase subunit A [Thermodesulfobacteriota bacterium]